MKNKLATVVNIRKFPRDYDVYVGRAGLGFDGTFGNPFRVGYDGSRTEVVDKFRKYFQKRMLGDIEYSKKIFALRGLRLGCWCAPKPCHADIIADWLNSLQEVT